MVDALDAGTHQLRQTLQRPDHEVDLTNALFRVLLAGTKIQCGSVVDVVAPKHHLARECLVSDFMLVSIKAVKRTVGTSGSTCEAVITS